MHWLDWSIIGCYIALVTTIGLLFMRRAGGSVAEFFVAGRRLPWWIAGTSLVATSFAADTPLAITGIVAEKGIAGNWLWWNQVVAWTLAIAVFARLWRRVGVITDAEFIELRYGGRPGAFLRGFKAFYVSVIFSTFTLAWVMLAMQKIVSATIAEPHWVVSLEQAIANSFGWAAGSFDAWKWIVLIALFVTATLYTVMSGFWGIVITDLFQFGVAIVASMLFAFYAVDAVGGVESLKTKLADRLGADQASDLLAFWPGSGSEWMPLSAFVVYLSILWWGDCSGGIGTQRMFSARSERDSVLTAVWYSVAHFALRPWPWIVVALVALVYYPDLADRESGYPMLIMDVLPIGLRGLMIASLLAAFMSTVDTHLNWNASYFVNDFYKRFWRPLANERQCIRVSRLATLGFALLSIVLAYFMNSIKDAWLVLFNLQAGIGLVLMVRWFWWRVNAWSEISAMVASLVSTTAFRTLTDWSATTCILATSVTCSLVWVTVTLLTPHSDWDTLQRFYRQARPSGFLWNAVKRRCPEAGRSELTWQSLLAWPLSAAALYALTFTIGKLVLQEYSDAAIPMVATVAFGIPAWLFFGKTQTPTPT
ncbi:MAG: sodium:solute symporter family protein [Phycisphaerae bacterium]